MSDESVESQEHERLEGGVEEDDAPIFKTPAEEEREVKRILTEIRLAKNSPIRKKFLKEGQQVIKKYRNESQTSTDMNIRNDTSRYNVTWSSIQTMKPSFYSRTPKPAVIRLHKNENPVKRLAVTIAERCTAFSLKQEEDLFNQVMETCVEDRLLPGLGVSRVTFDAESVEQIGPDGQPILSTTNEKSGTKYVYWQDFLYSHGRVWGQDVEWMAFRHVLGRKEVKKQFGEDVCKSLAFTAADPNAEKILESQEERNYHKKAEIFEYWCKESKRLYWVSEGLPGKFLKVEEDPLRLDSFFPAPRPLMATCTSDSLTPVCDYRITKAIVEDIDFCYRRLSELVDCVRFIGLHDASVSDQMIQMRNLPDGRTIPVRSWAAFAEKGGIKGCVDFFPVEKVMGVIQQLAEYGQMLLQQYYEITGIPDIIRGSSAPSESATAQQFKGQFATIRIADKQQDVQRFCRDLIALKAELIFEFFSDQTIMMMSDFDDMTEEEQQMFPMALQILREDRAREFVIDIETDSTLALDENAEKAARLEYLSSLGQFFQNAIGMVQALPEAAELAFESVKFGVGAFRQGRELEGMVDSTIQAVKEKIAADKEAQAQQAEAAANQPPPRDPNEIKAEADQMIAQFRAQLDAQTQQQKMQLEQEKAAQKAQIDQAMAQQKMAIEEMKASQEIMLKKFKAESEVSLEAQRILNDRTKLLSEAGDSEQIRAMQDLGLIRKPTSRKRVKIHRDATGEIAGIEAEDVD